MSDANLPPLNWLRAFEAAARHLTFTSAAGDLGMSQPAVSQHVKALETFLGLTLFTRHPRRLELTVAGQSYLPTVQSAIDLLSHGTRALVGGDRGRVLTVHCNLAFSVFWLAPRLGGLLIRFPWLTVNTVSTLWNPEHPVDAAAVEIRFGRSIENRFDCKRLNHDTCFPVCSPVLAGENWYDHTLFDCVGMECDWQSWVKGTDQTMPSHMRVNNASTYAVSLSAAQGGAGFALGHETLVSGLISQDLLVRASALSIEMPEAYFLMTLDERLQTPSSRSFIDWLLSETAAQ